MLGFNALGILPVGQEAFGSSATNLTLTASPGAYVLTGVAVGFDDKLASVAGAYSIAGSAALLSESFACAAGSYAVAGVVVTFGRTLVTAAGSYALSGVAAALNSKEIAAAGSYSIAGVAAVAPRTFLAAAGSYAVTGYALVTNTILIAGAGAYAFAWTDTPLIRTGFDYEFQQGGVGHLLYERERAKQLAAITRRVPPPPIDRTTRPTFAAIGRPPIAPPIGAPMVQAGPIQPTGAPGADAVATKRRRDMEAILLLVA